MSGLREELQRQCYDWGTYWRAPDSHGVELSHAQAVELLENALGVEVEIKDTSLIADGDAKDAARWRCLENLVDPHNREYWYVHPGEGADRMKSAAQLRRHIDTALQQAADGVGADRG